MIHPASSNALNLRRSQVKDKGCPFECTVSLCVNARERRYKPMYCLVTGVQVVLILLPILFKTRITGNQTWREQNMSIVSYVHKTTLHPNPSHLRDLIGKLSCFSIRAARSNHHNSKVMKNKLDKMDTNSGNLQIKNHSCTFDKSIKAAAKTKRSQMHKTISIDY